jgi:hypothetical protein
MEIGQVGPNGNRIVGFPHGLSQGPGREVLLNTCTRSTHDDLEVRNIEEPSRCLIPGLM